MNQINRLYEQLKYLEKCLQENYISESVYREATRLSRELDIYPIPAACTGPDGEMFYSWDRDEHHLEIEIIEGEPTAFFYANRNTKRTWFEEAQIGAPPPPKEFISLMKLLYSYMHPPTGD